VCEEIAKMSMSSCSMGRGRSVVAVVVLNVTGVGIENVEKWSQLGCTVGQA